MIRRVLVANRAEIASRVFRTCRSLGIETVAIHSDADALLPYVREADAAVRLPGNAPGETYLRGDLIVEAGKTAGADAVHPGYGFLSENAAFARTVIDAGLTWIGPAPESIEQMGSKVEAKKLMEAAGVPVLANLTPDTATEADLPLLMKASAGGGGRGMRVVRTLADLPREIEAARAEAESAFGDGTVFVEPYVERGRHVEVQVVGTPGGGVLVLGERDCSIQRRHQKVVEETPAPRLPESTRRALHDAGGAAAVAVEYLGAGTVEFLYDEERDRFYFLEMNTRLQVEHPVTELVWGVDLVELQLLVAEGVDVAMTAMGNPGHAIEVRLYAEDPAAGYQPQSGVLSTFEIPEGVRVDAGYESGSEVSTHYDAMVAKLVAYGGTREEAIRRLVATLGRARIHGVTTNREQLLAILRDEAFVDGRVSTAFLDGFEVPTSDDTGAPVAAALALAERDAAARRVQQGVPIAWRNVPSQPQLTRFEGEVEVRWWGRRDGYSVDGHTVVAAGPDRVVLETDGVRTAYDVAVRGEVVDVDSPRGHVALRVVPRFVDPSEVLASGSLLAPMPGTVTRVAVEDGATVAAGDAVLVLEAMKMQHTISAPTDGVVTDLVALGSQVAAGDVLAVVSTSSTSNDEGEA